MVLFNAGAQVPVIPFREVVGNGFIDEPVQVDGMEAKVGVTCDIIDTIAAILVLSHPFTVCDT
jgi:hypothetical protein